MYCKNCGKQFEGNAMYCTNCGAKKDEADISKNKIPYSFPGKAYKNTKKKNKGGLLKAVLFTFLALCAFLVCCLAVDSFINGSDINESEAAIASTTTVPETTITTKTETTTKQEDDKLWFIGGEIEDCGYKYWDGELYIIMLFRFTNTGKRAACMNDRCNIKLFQNGVECERAIIPPLYLDYDEEINQDFTEVKQGVTIDVNMVYRLRSEKGEFEVEVRSPKSKDVCYGGWKHKGR